MARGDLVGDAYVRIHADTTFMRRAIRRAAKKDAEDYERTFSKNVQLYADREFENNRNRLAKAVALQDFSEFQKQFGGVERAVEHVNQELDELVSKNKIYKKDVDVVRKALDKWAIPAQMREELDSAHRAALKMNEEFDHLDKLGFKAMQHDLRNVGEALAKNERDIDDAERAAHRLNKEYERQVQLGERLAQAAEKLELKRVTKDWKALRIAMHRAEPDVERTRDLLSRHGIIVKKLSNDLAKGHSLFSRWSTAVGKATKKGHEFGDAISGMFGKGSRNDFLNIFGGVVGGIAKVFTTLPFAIVQKFTGKIGELTDNFKGLRFAGAGLAEALGSTLMLGAQGAAGALVGLVAIMTAGAVALPALVSGVWSLVGGLTAIAGVLSVGVVGALLPIAPLAIAALAAFGAIALAVAKMNALKKATKKGDWVPDSLKQFHDAFINLGKETEKSSDKMLVALGRLAPFIRDFITPLVKNMGDVLARVGEDFAKIMNSPVMKDFLDVWKTALPDSFEQFGLGLNNLIASIFSFLTPILPYTFDLAARFRGMTENFLEWSSSAEGQNAIADFMSKAWDAAKKLWDTLKNVAGIIGKVFMAGTEKGGIDFLTWLRDATDRLNTFLSTPEGKKALSDWFSDALETMKTVKGILGDVWNFFQDLNTPQGKSDFQSFLGSLKSLADSGETIANAITTISNAFHSLISVTGSDDAVNSLHVWDEFPGYLSGIGESVNQALTDMGVNVNTALTSIGTTVNGWLDSLPFGAVGEMLTGFGTTVNGWLDTLQQSLMDFSNWVMTGFGLEGNFSKIGEWIVSPFRWAWDQLFGHSYIPDIVNGFQTFLPRIPGIIQSALSSVGNFLTTPFRLAWTALTTLLGEIGSSIATTASGWATQAGRAVSGITSHLTSPFAEAKRIISGIMDEIGRLIAKIPGLKDTVDRARSTIGGIISGLGDQLAKVPGLNSLINAPKKAAGGVLYGAQYVIAGEAGPEAIVPLNRPLSMVDPAVRELSAFAQGKNYMARGGVVGAGRAITIAPGAIVVQSPHSDPALVAEAVLDRIVGFGM